MSAKTSVVTRAMAYVSSEAALFEERPVAVMPAAVPDVCVYPKATRQTIEGFGGAFNCTVRLASIPGPGLESSDHPITAGRQLRVGAVDLYLAGHIERGGASSVLCYERRR